MYSYSYNNIKFFSSKFKIDCYKCYYEYFFLNNIYTVYLYNYEDEDNEYSYAVQDKDLKIAKKLFKNKIKTDIKNGMIEQLIKSNYKIYVDLPQILKNYNFNVGYHVTPTTNKNSILKNGLIPNYIIDESVLNASYLIDKQKPSNKYLNFERKNCIYLHPELENDFFSQSNGYYKSSVLFAVDFSDYINNAIIGSSGLGGFCLYENGDNPNFKDLTKYAKQYWKYSKSLTEYLNTKINKTPYEYSEIIINTPIPKEKITYLGYWDKNGKFHFSKYFYHFVKEEYKTSYKNILKFYV